MRITKNYHTVGEKRIKTRFLWFPRTLGNETRWLERASWVEYYSSIYNGYPNGYSNKWVARCWVRTGLWRYK